MRKEFTFVNGNARYVVECFDTSASSVQIRLYEANAITNIWFDSGYRYIHSHCKTGIPYNRDKVYYYYPMFEKITLDYVERGTGEYLENKEDIKAIFTTLFPMCEFEYQNLRKNPLHRKWNRNYKEITPSNIGPLDQLILVSDELRCKIYVKMGSLPENSEVKLVYPTSDLQDSVEKTMRFAKGEREWIILNYGKSGYNQRIETKVEGLAKALIETAFSD